MATLNSNNAYLEWDGTDLSGYWTEEISHESTVDLEDITAGAGSTYIQQAPKLKTLTISFMIVYDGADVSTYKDLLEPGKEATLKWGPEGNGAGKPKLECDMILQSVSGPNQTVDKAKLAFELSFEKGASDPVSTLTGTLAGTF